MGATWWDAAAGLLLGLTCAGCGAPGRVWCLACRGDLECLADPVRVFDDPPVFAALPYVPPVPGAVVAYKDRGLAAAGPALAGSLALAIGAVAAAVTGGPDGPAGRPGAVVPIPSSPAAVRRRGVAHMHLLAALAVGYLPDLPLSVSDLLVSAPSRDQAGLDWARRRGNRANTYRVRRAPTGPVIVVDDVLTSGATMAAAADSLRRAGAGPVAGAVIASVKVTPGAR